jgi:hypothetical protein
MPSLLVAFTLLTMYSVMGQKLSNPIFNPKHFPKIELKDSLSNNSQESYFLNRLRNLKNDEISLVKPKSIMPVFKPKHNSSMPINGIDTTNTYFLRVYPLPKD